MPTVSITRHTRSQQATSSAGRGRERRALLAATVVLALGILLTYQGKNDAFEEVETALAAGKIINLSEIGSPDPLLALLRNRFVDATDRRFLADTLYRQISTRQAETSFGAVLPNVGFLNTASFHVHARTIEQHGGRDLKRRLGDSFRALGLTPSLLAREKNTPLQPYPATQPATADGFTIEGRITKPDGLPFADALVSLVVTQGGVASRHDTLRTAADGRYAFAGLAAGADLAILPMQPYFEFRRQRLFNLADNHQLDFEAAPHTLRPLDSRTYQRLKPALVVRTPVDYRNTVLVLTLIFFVVFWGIHAIWSWRRFTGDALLLPIVMLLCGFGFMLILTLKDPLRDQFLAIQMIEGLAIGGIGLLLVSLIDVQGWGRKWGLGWKSFLWLGVALVLSTALLLFGYGPEGSDAKVNIFGLQPVEAIKLCLLIFFAGYFVRTWRVMRDQQDMLVKSWLPGWARRVAVPQVRYVFPIIFGVGLALLFFFLQGDLGPALVFITTFLVLYGIVRKRWPAVVVGFVALVAGFTFFYQVGKPAKLVNRVEMMLTPWENVVYGGDHLAQSYWTYATGGLAGQGLGEGNANLMPAAHTDMVLPSIGEETGFFGVILVLALYLLLLYRGRHIARKRSADFGFFLILGLIFSSAFQIILITGGTLGLVPLSGVVSPFLSYGRSALILHLLFIGLLAGLSKAPAGRGNIELADENFAVPIRWVMLIVAGCFGLLALRAAWIQVFRGGSWLIKPALVERSDGALAYVYNPRIGTIRDALQRGSIYDRNDIVLATNRFEELEANRTTYDSMGVDLEQLRAQAEERYYPFGITTLFLLGDLNKQFLQSKNALYAEYDTLSHLRGYRNNPQAVETRIETRDAVRTGLVTRYDYTQIRPILRDGLDSRAFRRLEAQNRDIALTIDVRLQDRITRLLRTQAQSNALLEGKPIGAVVIDPVGGDVLAAVTYPLPDAVYRDLETAKNDTRLRELSFAPPDLAPGSTIKLATAMAAFRVGGNAAGQWTVQVAGDKSRHETPENWYRPGSGPRGAVDLERAIVLSSNVYFADIAKERIKASVLVEVFDLFGFGVQAIETDPESGAERIVNLPTRGAQIAQVNTLRNLEQVSFGQGVVVGNPLQAARMAGVVANNGQLADVRWYYEPNNPPSPPTEVITERQAQMLGCYMRKVVTEGTGRRLLSYESGRRTTSNACGSDAFFQIAGKTGTAERTVRINGRRRTRNHAWFTGYAPYRTRFDPDEPKIAVAVMVANLPEGNGGGRVAGPIAGAIFQEAAALGLIRDEY